MWWLLACATPELPTCEDTDTACFRGFFRTLLGGPVEGMSLCAEESCTSTDSDGAFVLAGLPLETDVAVLAEHPDYVPTLFGQHTSMAWYDWYKVAIPQSVMDQNASTLDVELAADQGHVLFLAWEGLNIDGVDTDNVAGVTASVAGGGVFYANGLGLADAGATESSGSGSGGALNLEPGSVEVTLTSAAGVCGGEHMFHFQGAEGVIPVPVEAGFTSAIDVQCD